MGTHHPEHISIDPPTPHPYSHVMLDIATGIMSSLDGPKLQILYDMLPPLLKDDKDRTLQKKAYRVLSCMHETCRDAMLPHLQNSFAILVESQLSTAVGARLYRLKVSWHGCEVRFGIGFMQKQPILFDHFPENNQLFRLYAIKIITLSKLLFSR